MNLVASKRESIKKIIAFFLLFTVTIIANSANSEATQDSTKEKYFEISFGQSILFISNSKVLDLKKNESVVLPTNAILFFVELRPYKKLRIPIFLNLATETKQFLINNTIVNERASPTLGTGIQYRIFNYPLGKKNRVELELGPVCSFLFDSNDNFRLAPIIAGRIRLLKKEDFVLYFGNSYSIGINAFGILFGTGYIF
ncbi:MAG: hypothetical protein J0M08_11590 [Bacteroidetes bacterium]|nr:hypothetical protein [Bacteroidota bacterium]